MITPIEYRMRCDNGATCVGAYTRRDALPDDLIDKADQVLKANSHGL